MISLCEKSEFHVHFRKEMLITKIWKILVITPNMSSANDH